MSTTTDMVSTEGELPGMPPPWELRLDTVGENAVVSCGRRALACYDIGDRGARRIAIVSLTRAGFSCNEVARVFGVHAAHVSRLRGKANEGGVAALLTEPGRRRKLDARGIARVYEMHDQGVAGGELAKQLGVSGSAISRLMTARPAREADRLPFADRSDGVDRSDGADRSDWADRSDAADADADAGAVTPVAGVSESNAASGVIAAASGSDLVDGSTGVVGGEALAARGAAMTAPRWRCRACSRLRWVAPRLRAQSICSPLMRGCWSGSGASRICGRSVRGWRRWPTRSTRSRCRSRSPRRCSPLTQSPRACSSSMGISWPTPVRGLSPRAITRAGVTPSPDVRIPSWSMSAGARCASPPGRLRACARGCSARLTSCRRSAGGGG